MSVDRGRIRALVRRELQRRLGEPRLEGNAALEEFPSRTAEGDGEAPGPCAIEPDKPCVQSGYCKKLGY